MKVWVHMYTERYSQWGIIWATSESRWAVFIVLFLQFSFKLVIFQNKQLERRENMLDWMRKAMEGRTAVGKSFPQLQDVLEGSGRQCRMASWLEASGRKQNIWCSCDLGPASLGISAMQLFVLNTHITSFHFISIFHTKKMRSYSRPTHSMGGALAGLVDAFFSRAPLRVISILPPQSCCEITVKWL